MQPRYEDPPTTYRKVAAPPEYTPDGRPTSYRALPSAGQYGGTTYGPAGGAAYGSATVSPSYGFGRDAGDVGYPAVYDAPTVYEGTALYDADPAAGREAGEGSTTYGSAAAGASYADGGYASTYGTTYGGATERYDDYGDTAYPDTAYSDGAYGDATYGGVAYADDPRYEEPTDYRPGEYEGYDADRYEDLPAAYSRLPTEDGYDDGYASRYDIDRPLRPRDYDPYSDDPYRDDPYRDDPYRDDRPTQRSAPFRDDYDRYDTATRLRAASGRHRADDEEEDERTGSGKRAASRSRRAVPLWQELPLLVIIAFSLALVIKTFLLQAFFIPSGSMENTLLIRDRVLVNKVVYQFREPQRGEVIVFRGTDSWAPETDVQRPDGFVANASRQLSSLVGFGTPDEKDFIKRVIGVPGDQVQCCDPQGRILVNGKPMDEPYVFDNNPIDQRAFGPITVPPGRLFMMGDHRGNSQDSRAYIGDEFKGTVPIDEVIGRAFVKVWPVSSWDDLPVPEGFDTVPAARAIGPPAPAVGTGGPSTPGGVAESPFLLALLLPFARRRRRRRHRRR
jgi:signal peptidase I